MADAHALGACVLIDVRVRIPPSPPIVKSSPGLHRYPKHRAVGRCKLDAGRAAYFGSTQGSSSFPRWRPRFALGSIANP